MSLAPFWNGGVVVEHQTGPGSQVVLCCQQQLGLQCSRHSCLWFKGRYQAKTFLILMKLTDHKVKDRFSEELKIR